MKIQPSNPAREHEGAAPAPAAPCCSAGHPRPSDSTQRVCQQPCRLASQPAQAEAQGTKRPKRSLTRLETGKMSVKAAGGFSQRCRLGVR